MVDLLPFDLLDDIFCETQTFFDFYCDDGNLESLDNFSFVPLDDITPDVVDSVVNEIYCAAVYGMKFINFLG